MNIIHGLFWWLIGCLSFLILTQLNNHYGSDSRIVGQLSCLIPGISRYFSICSERSSRHPQHNELSTIPEGLYLFQNDANDVTLYFSPFKIFPEFKEDQIENKADSVEALMALHGALEMKHSGKYEKAMRLLKHALALSPSHPDILNFYGEILEEAKSNYVEADFHYKRALSFSPDHTRALENRKRTLPLVEELDERLLYRIETKRDEILKASGNRGSLNRIKKEVYFQHIYHTVGIEGNTMTLAQTRMIIETRMAVGGKSLMEHNEILGMDEALRYINSTLLHKVGDISENDILQLHNRVLGFVDPTEGGTYRHTQVFVGDHIPPPPNEIKYLMSEFISWLNSVDTVDLHPVKYAALAHYKLVYIHPFTDGNGRTSRLIMNLILMRAGYPPVIIKKEDRLKYYETLKAANEGDVRPFIRFIARSAEKTLDIYLWAIGNKSVPVPELGSDTTLKDSIIQMQGERMPTCVMSSCERN
ncbi:protein adenylyltransferase Fic-like isoform X2 [Artemia franciscana]|uniref:protein adenylyltransferase Fic-like isoform X2 n=1 Tax=Artemia franciscana TaxID=6661 RepID=UPI0032DAEBF9